MLVGSRRLYPFNFRDSVLLGCILVCCSRHAGHEIRTQRFRTRGMESQGAPSTARRRYSALLGVSRKVRVWRGGGVLSTLGWSIALVARREPALEEIRLVPPCPGTPLPRCAEPHVCFSSTRRILGVSKPHLQHTACISWFAIVRISMPLGALPSVCWSRMESRFYGRFSSEGPWLANESSHL